MILKNQKGMALISVLIILTITSLLGTTVYYASSQESLSSELDENKTQAYYFAQSGVEAAIGLIDSGKINDYLVEDNGVNKVTFYGDLNSFQTASKDDYSIKYTIIEEKPDTSYIIESEGRVVGRNSVQAINSNQRVRYESHTGAGGGGTGTGGVPNLENMALFAAENITMAGNCQIKGDVITNSIADNSVKLNGNVKIYDNLFIGPGGIPDNVVDKRGNVKVKNLDVLSDARNYPMPKFPEYPELPHAIFSGKTIEADAWYRKIEIKGNSTLIIDVGDKDRLIRVGELDIKGNGHIKLRGKGRLILYVEDSFNMDGNCTVNLGGDYKSVVMYFGGNELDLKGNTTFVGSLFAKQSNLVINGNEGVTGHIITGGNEVEVKGNTNYNVRVLYAPNALLKMNGNGNIWGTVVTKIFYANGNVDVYYNDSIDLGFFQMLDWGEEGTTTAGRRTYLNY